MLVDEMMTVYSPMSNSIPDASWLSGALAGMRVAGDKDAWDWQTFLDDIRDMAYNLEVVKATEPGNEPSGRGSAYDVLGGFVSVSGTVSSNGLHVHVPLVKQSRIIESIPGMVLLRSRKGLVIPTYELESFTRLVPIRGPLADELDELIRSERLEVSA
ncbi:MAG: hypothetical protein RTU92_08795 [Candidatus Thorarchaeota archaeon]